MLIADTVVLLTSDIVASLYLCAYLSSQVYDYRIDSFHRNSNGIPWPGIPACCHHAALWNPRQPGSRSQQPAASRQPGIMQQACGWADVVWGKFTAGLPWLNWNTSFTAQKILRPLCPPRNPSVSGSHGGRIHYPYFQRPTILRAGAYGVRCT